jgi:hypothetical protein
MGLTISPPNAAGLLPASVTGLALLAAANAAAPPATAVPLVTDAVGNMYITPFLRYTPGNPPQEQTLQGGVWVTVRSVA